MNALPSGPWALHRPVYEQLARLAAGPGPRVDARLKPSETFDKGAARVIPISGVLVKSVPAWMTAFGVRATSYSWLIRQVTDALHDKSVDRIHLLIDSPGGHVGGSDPLMSTLDEAGKLKLVTAHTVSMCASAAYWIAAHAHIVSASATALVGSIGVYSVIDDSSRAAEASGVKVHVIASGPLKGAGVDGAPVLPEHLASEQRLVDGMAAEFFAAVRRGRGRRLKDDGTVFSGAAWVAGDAVALGLVDAINNTSEGI